MANIVWKDRKRTLFGLPWSFTKYSLSDDRLFISTGFFNTKEDEVRLYRIMDISLNRTLGQRMLRSRTSRNPRMLKNFYPRWLKMKEIARKSQAVNSLTMKIANSMTDTTTCSRS